MKKALIGAGLLAIVAATVVWSGVISVKASSGHLAPTYWMLDLVKRRSVVMRARGLETPPLDEAALVGLGAAHFERGCRSCHGAPGVALPLVPARMTPAPPDLARQVGRWQARELFYLVAHGVKFTGMPAWPAPARTDEVWALVAFLQRLPTLDHLAYQRLLRADDALDPERPTVRCDTCHHDGSALVPALEGQTKTYLTAALEAYATGRRHSGIMQTVAATLSGPDRAHYAEVYASPAEPPPALATTTLPAAGIVHQGDPDRDIPACAGCHGPADGPRDPMYPRLAGQPAAYLRLQLQLFAEGRRGGSSYAPIMQAIATRLTASQIDDAVTTYAAMPAGR